MCEIYNIALLGNFRAYWERRASVSSPLPPEVRTLSLNRLAGKLNLPDDREVLFAVEVLTYEITIWFKSKLVS
jgi:hypothetical protein